MYLGTLNSLDLATAQADVTAAFESLFGRAPASSGLSFYANQLVSGSLSESGLYAAVLANASAADLAYYNAHNGVTPTPTPASAPAPAQSPAPTPTPATVAPASSNLTTQANIAAEAAVSPNALILTPGVNDYAAQEKNVYINTGMDGGILSQAQVWVDLTGHTQQWWQAVQAAFTAGKSPTATSIPDTWLSGVPTAAVPMGSAQAIANLKQALPDYIQFLTNASMSAAAIAAKLASFGVDMNGNPLAASATPTPAPTGAIYQAPAPTPIPAPTPTPTAAGYTAPAPQNQVATIPSASNIAATASPNVLPTTAPASGGYSGGGGGASSYSEPSPEQTRAAVTSASGTMGISPLALAIGAAGLVLIANRKK
jgi:hypothetical protein